MIKAILIGLSIATAPTPAHAGTLMDYDAVAQKVWGHSVSQYVVTWGTTHSEMDAVCDTAHVVPADAITACATVGSEAGLGTQIHINWIDWMQYGRALRCQIFGHEYGHLLGHNHPGELFEKMMKRNARLCHRRWPRLMWSPDWKGY